MVLHTTGGWGLGSGMSWSSAWIGWAPSSGPMAMDDSDDSRQPSSSTASTTGNTLWVGMRPNTSPWASRL